MNWIYWTLRLSTGQYPNSAMPRVPLSLPECAQNLYFGLSQNYRGGSAYQQAVKFGQLSVEEGFMVITGGAAGIMKAGIEGAGVRKQLRSKNLTAL